MKEIEINGLMRDHFKKFELVGCVYPTDEDSYYIDTNCVNIAQEMGLEEHIVKCSDGMFYGWK